MLTIPNDPQALRDKIKKDLDILDTDELQQLYRVFARVAAKKAIRFADSDWIEKGLSRDHINKEINSYRKSPGK